MVQVTELLFQKQMQLERLAAEKAAQQLSLERELDAAREQAECVNRCRPTTVSFITTHHISRRAASLSLTGIPDLCVDIPAS